jgi:hypothetical protein
MDHFACYHAGVNLSDSDTWVPSIKNSGPGGNYLTAPMTLNNFRQIHYSEYFDRSMTEIPPPMEIKIKERTLEIINSHKPKELSSDQTEIIENSWSRWENEIHQ